MKKKIIEFLTNAWDEMQYALRLLCGKPTPLKRFIMVLIIGGALAVANIYLVVSSIYNIGKRDAEKEFLELQHIETLELQKQKESINNSNLNKYEYDNNQQSE
jgi:ABC-type lipoprotein release transport system permease subunit